MKYHQFVVGVQKTGPLTKAQLKRVAASIQDTLQDVNDITGLMEDGSDTNDGLGLKVTCKPVECLSVKGST